MQNGDQLEHVQGHHPISGKQKQTAGQAATVWLACNKICKRSNMLPHMLLTLSVGVGAGPHLLDLGDVLYAPNCFQDAQGRSIMLAWLQELRQGGGFDYAGCISLPRVLSYKSKPLHRTAQLVLVSSCSWASDESRCTYQHIMSRCVHCL